MKYFNKEWYKTKDNIKLEFKVSSKAAKFSEENFTTEYNRSLNKFLKENSCFGEEAKDIFKEIYNNYLNLFPSYFPKRILEKVKDIRMLALGKVSKNNYNIIQNYANEKNYNYNKVAEKYMKEYNKIKNRLPENIKKQMNLHDCQITDILRNENKLIIKLDCSSGYIDISNLTFENYEVIEEEMDFINGWCLCEEIYIVNNQYELHLLIDIIDNDDESNLGYFTIRAKNIVLT